MLPQNEFVNSLPHFKQTMPPTDSIPFANDNQLLGKEERIQCIQNFDPEDYETTDDDETESDSICSDASDIETVDTQRNASGPCNTSLLSDESTFVQLDETYDAAGLTGLEENEQDLGTSIQQNLEVATDAVNGVLLTKLGKNNRSKLKTTGQYPDGPKSKKCNHCNQSMDWRTSGTLLPKKDNSGELVKYYYNTAHNGNCVKESYSDKNSAKVSLYFCQNFQSYSPRINRPSLLWLVYQEIFWLLFYLECRC